MSFASHLTSLNSEPLPPRARLIGYAAIAEAMGYRRPVREPHITFDNNTRTRQIDSFQVVGARKAPKDDLFSHLDYALRQETLNLAVLKLLFQDLDRSKLASFIQESPLSVSRRRLWLLYEWMTLGELPIEDLKSGNYADLLDRDQYVAGEGNAWRRQRVRLNLLGTQDYAPIIRRTAGNSPDRTRRISQAIGTSCDSIERGLLRRAVGSLILGETKTTYALEQEHPPRNKLERWGQAIAHAGRGRITAGEIARLQGLVLPDGSNLQLGWRDTQNFIGSFDRNYEASPERINPKPEDLPLMMENWLGWLHDSKEIDPIIAAAASSFSFVYLHPLEDGNGRLHRYLLHHVLAERGFTPKGIVFPLSMPILEKADDYRSILNRFDEQVMPFTDWRPNGMGGVEVLNETADLFRFMDLTEESEFIFDCVEDAALRRLPEEVDAIRKADVSMERLSRLVDMPEQRLRLFVALVKQNQERSGDYALPNKRRKRDFSDLDAETVDEMLDVLREVYKDDPEDTQQPSPGM